MPRSFHLLRGCNNLFQNYLPVGMKCYVWFRFPGRESISSVFNFIDLSTFLISYVQDVSFSFVVFSLGISYNSM